MDSLKFRLNGNQLKLIAVISMLVDHAAFVFYNKYFMYTSMRELVYYGIRGFGRIAFPIYAFLLAEGFCHTRNLRNYAIRLLICALISEIPYNYMVSGNFLYAEMQNIFWTLLLGLLMMKCLKEAVIRYPGTTGKQLQLVVIVAFCTIAWMFKVDYDYRGIMLIGLLCWFYGDLPQMCMAALIWMLVTMGSLNVFSLLQAVGYAASSFLIYHYDGTRGIWNGKAFFYAFYPVHLIILDIIKTLWWFF